MCKPKALAPSLSLGSVLDTANSCNRITPRAPQKEMERHGKMAVWPKCIPTQPKIHFALGHCSSVTAATTEGNTSFHNKTKSQILQGCPCKEKLGRSGFNFIKGAPSQQKAKRQLTKEVEYANVLCQGLNFKI